MRLNNIMIFIILILSILLSSCASRSPQPESISTIIIGEAPSKFPTPTFRSYNSAQEYIDDALASFNQKNYRETLGFLNEALKRDSDDFRAYALRGVTWSLLGEGNKARQDFQKTIGINSKSKESETSRLWLEKLNNPLSVAVAPLNLNTTVNLINNRKTTYRINGKKETGTRAEIIQKQYANFSQSNYDPTFKSVLSRGGFFQPATLYLSNKLLIHELCRFSDNQGTKIFIHSKRADLNLIEKPYSATFMYTTRAGVLPLATPPSYFEGNTSYDLELIFDINVYATKQCNMVTTFNKSMTARNVSGNQVGSVISHMLDVLFHEINLEIHDALL